MNGQFRRLGCKLKRKKQITSFDIVNCSRTEFISCSSIENIQLVYFSIVSKQPVACSLFNASTVWFFDGTSTTPISRCCVNDKVNDNVNRCIRTDLKNLHIKCL